MGGLHSHSSTEDNATSFSNQIKPSVDLAANRTKTVAVVANTEPTKSRHRSFPNVGQTDSTSDEVPQRPKLHLRSQEWVRQYPS